MPPGRELLQVRGLYALFRTWPTADAVSQNWATFIACMTELTTPTVAVIIPCFNAKPYIAATLESVLSQEGVDLEVIVVDDGSRDGSGDLVEQQFPHVRLIRKGNGGVAAARNVGLAAARAQWIAFCDADDIWLPGKLQAQLEALAKCPASRMSYTAWHVWPSSEPRPDAALLRELAHDASPGRWQGPSGSIYPDLLLDCEVWTSTVLANRSLFDEVGVFDTALKIGEDYDLWLRASRATDIIRVPRPLALYRQHPANITRATPTTNYRLQVVGAAIQRWGYRGPDGRDVDRAALRRRLAMTCSDFAVALLNAGQPRAARQSIREALRFNPVHLPSWKLLVRSFLDRAR